MKKLDLKPEIRCDFLIDENRKKVWQVELDLLEEVIRICNRYEIKYSVAAGTMLGAVRHNGFIPWDDDIDIMMKRNEYNRFLKVALKELKYPYFLQYYKTEKGYYYGHAQIRNSETTALIELDKYNNFNHGIFLDIFPEDNIPDLVFERNKFIRKILFKKKIILSYYNFNSKNIFKKLIRIILKQTYWRMKNIDKSIEDLELFVQKFNEEETEESCSLAFNPLGFKIKNKYFDRFELMDFEYLKISILSNYDEILKKQYGNYWEFPKNKNSSDHGKVFFDTTKSYKEYKN